MSHSMIINKTEDILKELEIAISKYKFCNIGHNECNGITNLIQICIDKKIQFTNDLIQKIISRSFCGTNYKTLCISNPIVKKKLENFINYVTLPYNSLINLIQYNNYNFINLYLMKKTTKLSSFDYCNLLKISRHNADIMSLIKKYDHIIDITDDIIEVASIYNIIFILEKIIIDKIKVDNKILSNILFVKNLSFANKLINNGTDITIETLENLFSPPIKFADNIYDKCFGYIKQYPYRKLNESVEFILDKKIKPSELAFSNMLLYFGQYRFARQKISKSIIKNLKDEQLENYKNSGKCVYNSDANEIINLFIGAGYIIKYKDFVLAVKAGVEINDIERFDIKFDDNFMEECSKAGFFPYNIKYKPTLALLRNECLKPQNHGKVIELCETINPDIICLRNACSNIETSKTIDYLLEEKKIKPDIMCLLNICKSSTSSSIRKLASIFLDNLSDDHKKILNESNDIFIYNKNTPNDKHEESCTDTDNSIISGLNLSFNEKIDNSESSKDYEELVKKSDDGKSQDESTESSNDYEELVKKSDDDKSQDESTESSKDYEELVEKSEEESSEEESSEEESSEEEISDENDSSVKESSEDDNSFNKKENIKKTIIKHPIRKETDKKKDLSNGDIKIVKKSLINKDIVIISDSESEEEIKEKPKMDKKLKKEGLQKKKDIILDSGSEKNIKTKKEINYKHDKTSSESPQIEKKIKTKYEEIPNEYEFKSLILINDKQAEFLGCKTKEIDHIEIKKKLLTLIKSKNLFDKKDKMKVIFTKDQIKLINFPDDNMMITDIDKMIYTYFVKNSKTV